MARMNSSATASASPRRKARSTAVNPDRDPARALEGDERLAHGDAADAEHGGDLVLGHPLAGPQLAVEDHPADQEGGFVAAAPPSQPRFVHARRARGLHHGSNKI